MRVPGFGLAQLGPEHEGIAHRDLRPGIQPEDDLVALRVLAPGLDLAQLEALIVPHEDDLLALDLLHRVARHQDIGDRGKISFLGQLLQLATVYDNATPNPELVHEVTKTSVASEWPRGAWCDCFADTIDLEVRLKPWAHSTKLGDEFPAAVRANKVMRELEE